MIPYLGLLVAGSITWIAWLFGTGAVALADAGSGVRQSSDHRDKEWRDEYGWADTASRASNAPKRL